MKPTENITLPHVAITAILATALGIALVKCDVVREVEKALKSNQTER